MYCQRIAGDANFSIDEWNEQMALAEELNLNVSEALPICHIQCDDCKRIVEERRAETQLLIEKLRL